MSEDHVNLVDMRQSQGAQAGEWTCRLLLLLRGDAVVQSLQGCRVRVGTHAF